MNLVNSVHKISYNNSTVARTGNRIMEENQPKENQWKKKISQCALMINSEHTQNWRWRSQAEVLFYGYTPSNNIPISSRMAQGLHTWTAAVLVLYHLIKQGFSPETHSLFVSVCFVSSWGLLTHRPCSSHKQSLTKAALSSLSMFLHQMSTQGNWLSPLLHYRISLVQNLR